MRRVVKGVLVVAGGLVVALLVLLLVLSERDRRATLDCVSNSGAAFVAEALSKAPLGSTLSVVRKKLAYELEGDKAGSCKSPDPIWGDGGATDDLGLSEEPPNDLFEPDASLPGLFFEGKSACCHLVQQPGPDGGLSVERIECVVLGWCGPWGELSVDVTLVFEHDVLVRVYAPPSRPP